MHTNCRKIKRPEKSICAHFTSEKYDVRKFIITSSEVITNKILVDIRDVQSLQA